MIAVLSMLLPGCSSGTNPTPGGSALPVDSSSAAIPPQPDAFPAVIVSQPGAGTADASDEALISVGQDGFSYRKRIANGAPVSDGTLVMANTASAPVRITNVTYQVDDKVTDQFGNGVNLLGTKVLPLRSRTEDSVGVQAGFPTTKAIADRWIDAIGAQIQPSASVPAYELVIGLAATNGRHKVSRVMIDYELAGQPHHADFRHSLTLCVPLVNSC